MTIWKPDTCDCKLEYNNRVRWTKTHNKCKLHISLSNQPLLDTVIAQNQRFNLAFNRSPSESQIEIIALSKRVNQLRIRSEDLTNFDEHLPQEKTLAVFRTLRRLLRLNP